MSAPAHLLREVARLVALFRTPEAGAEARRAALRATVRAARHATLDLEIDERTLRLNGAAHFVMTTAEEALVRTLRDGGVARLSVRRHAGARDVAHLAGLLAGPAVGIEGAQRTAGEALAHEMDALRLWSVRIVPAVPADPPRALPSALSAAVEAVRAADEAERARTCAALADATAEPLRDAEPEMRDDALRAVAAALALVPTTTPDDLAVGLGVQDEAAAGALLTDDAVTVAASALVRESTSAELRGAALALLRRAGDVGARGLLAELTAADTIAARRRCFDALLDLGSGIADLVTALHHPQWYVVRNVAELLGELEAREAEPALATLMGHGDARVREAVAVALDRLGTPGALNALRSALDDPSPTVRRLAVRAIASAPGAATGCSAAARLIAAFDRELDSEVRLEAVSALGRLGTFDALQRLLRLVGAREAHQGAAVRVAALHAITQARGEAAHATLWALIDDREPTVREEARRLLAAIAA